ncbi:MAG: shikimate dehydrogenase [Candidatus Omnitrophota bacterium]
MDRYGVIGWPIEHSLSPAMQNAAFNALGIEAKYEKIPIEPRLLEDFLLNNKEYKGFNITVPHKVKAREILQKKFNTAKTLSYPHYDKLSGAVNTVKRSGGDLEYCNTDPIGFRHSLEEDLGFKTTGKNVIVIGCGGAGRAIVSDLSDSAHRIRKIYLYDIDREAVDSMQRHLSDVLPDWNKGIEFIRESEISGKIEICQLLINTSPVGMREGDPSPIDRRLLRRDLYIYDVVYNRETQLVRDAISAGAPAVTGKGMLAAQGAFAFSFWTGCKPADVIGTMKDALSKALTSLT